MASYRQSFRRCKLFPQSDQRQTRMFSPNSCDNFHWFSRSTALLFLYAEEADSGIVHENTVGMAVGRSHSIVGPRPKQNIVHYNLHAHLTILPHMSYTKCLYL